MSRFGEQRRERLAADAQRMVAHDAGGVGVVGRDRRQIVGRKFDVVVVRRNRGWATAAASRVTSAPGPPARRPPCW